jgi:uncharacterized NAD(P)/FAD-binding protein YdhS
MSALAGEPDHFARRVEAEGGDRRGFAERRRFGRYLDEILAEAVGSGCTTVVDAYAVSADRAAGCWRIGLQGGEHIVAQAVALATGNQRPEALSAFESAGTRYIGDPWGPAACEAIKDVAATGGDALLVGTGLTMVDLVLSLDAAGHAGRIVAVSRRGQIPRAHADFQPAPIAAEEIPYGRLRSLWRWLRHRSAEVGWRAAVDSLRPHSQHLWQSLDPSSQRRFLRHVRPWWDVHRHRIAPQVAARIAQLIGENRLQVLSGRIIAASETPTGIAVDIQRRGAAESQRTTFAYAFNCTGPLHAIERTRDPLLRALLEGGDARPDHLGIGLEVDDNSRVGERLWALGPLTKGRYWEITAVPDIREQAARVAEDIAGELAA